MIAFWDALSRVLSQARHVTETETIPTVYAQSRVLAEDVYSLVDVPPADNSQMDGYAVRSAELAAASPEQPVALPVSARIPAGSRAGALAEGSVARIFTGAPVPRGADAVVPQELVTVDGDGLVVFTAPVAAGKFVRPAGGDLRAGQLVLAAGSKLTPARLGLLASTGRAYVKVYRPVRVAVFCSGNDD